ncbi:MAG: TPM domain-containing protein, partial [Clostridiales bacterium]|nr:TPM domain-containing protein [Clostridiales bacterium]
MLLILLVCLSLLSSLSVAQGAEYPRHTSDFYVNDFANVLDSSTESSISNTARQLEDSTKAQVVVVTMPDLDDQSLEEYATGLFRDWGIGSSETNNGVLLLVDVGGRQSRIEVGYGLEGALPDGKTGRIQDNWMLPYFREGDYSQGILQGFDAIVSEVYAEYGYEYDGLNDYDYYLDDEYQEYSDGQIPRPIIIVGIIVAIILMILDIRFTGGVFTNLILRSFFRGGRGGGSGGGGRRGGGGSSGGG